MDGWSPWVGPCPGPEASPRPPSSRPAVHTSAGQRVRVCALGPRPWNPASSAPCDPLGGGPGGSACLGWSSASVSLWPSTSKRWSTATGDGEADPRATRQSILCVSAPPSLAADSQLARAIASGAGHFKRRMPSACSLLALLSSPTIRDPILSCAALCVCWQPIALTRPPTHRNPTHDTTTPSSTQAPPPPSNSGRRTRQRGWKSIRSSVVVDLTSLSRPHRAGLDLTLPRLGLGRPRLILAPRRRRCNFQQRPANHTPSARQTARFPQRADGSCS